jgi:hypothetical protein
VTSPSRTAIRRTSALAVRRSSSRPIHPDGALGGGSSRACHSWLNRTREILIRWSKKDENHLALLQLASGLIAFEKARAATLAAAQPA